MRALDKMPPREVSVGMRVIAASGIIGEVVGKFGEEAVSIAWESSIFAQTLNLKEEGKWVFELN